MEPMQKGTLCAWCGKPIAPGEQFACFKEYGYGYKFFHNRFRIGDDCWVLYLLDHIKRVHAVIEAIEYGEPS